jgi:hypothetical protein
VLLAVLGSERGFQSRGQTRVREKKRVCVDNISLGVWFIFTAFSRAFGIWGREVRSASVGDLIHGSTAMR